MREKISDFKHNKSEPQKKDMILEKLPENILKIRDNGWYFIRGISRGKRVCHYFFDDKIIHNIYTKYGENSITTIRSCPDISKAKPCGVCLQILTAWQKVGLENRTFEK